MDFNQIASSNNLAQSNAFFEPKYINVEYIFYKIYLFFQNLFNGGGSGSYYDSGYDGGSYNSSASFWSSGGDFGGSSGVSGSVGGADFASFFNFVESILVLLIVFFITVIIYVVIRMIEIRKREGEYLEMKIREYAEMQKEQSLASGSNGIHPVQKNKRWGDILNLLSSDQNADWKIAIIDADSMLFDMLNKLDFEGDTLGEKLRFAKTDNFRNLSSAWEAHSIRNRIAHEGATYDLSLREARRAIALYEKVFREFDYI